MGLTNQSWLSLLIILMMLAVSCRGGLEADLEGFEEEDGSEQSVARESPSVTSGRHDSEGQGRSYVEDSDDSVEDLPGEESDEEQDEEAVEPGPARNRRPDKEGGQADAGAAELLYDPQASTTSGGKSELPFPINLLFNFAASRPGPPQIDYYKEAGLLLLLAVYLINIIVGWRRNRTIADAFARAFVMPPSNEPPAASAALDGTFFSSQFAQVIAPGASSSSVPLKQDSLSQYRLYATGRRHSQFLIATLNLKARQDLISQLWYVFQPIEDTLYVEVAVPEGTMPPVVLVAATPRVARRMAAELKDVAAFTHPITPSLEQLPKWPSERLVLLAENSSVVHDLLSEPRISAALAADAAGSRLFRSLHVSSELSTTAAIAGAESGTAGDSSSSGTSPWGPSVFPSALPPGTKCAVRFEFAVPGPERMEALAGLLALVPLVLDSVGVYRPAPDLRKRLLDQRARVDERAAKERAASADDAGRKAAKRREEKLAAEKDKLARMTPEARAKALEKQERREREKQFKKHIRKF